MHAFIRGGLAVAILFVTSILSARTALAHISISSGPAPANKSAI